VGAGIRRTLKAQRNAERDTASRIRIGRAGHERPLPFFDRHKNVALPAGSMTSGWAKPAVDRDGLSSLVLKLWGHAVDPNGNSFASKSRYVIDEAALAGDAREVVFTNVIGPDGPEPGTEEFERTIVSFARAVEEFETDVARSVAGNPRAQCFKHGAIGLPAGLSHTGRIRLAERILTPLLEADLPVVAAIQRPSMQRGTQDARNFHLQFVVANRPLLSSAQHSWEFALLKDQDTLGPAGIQRWRQYIVNCFNEALTAEGLEPCFTALTRQERGLSSRLDQAQHDPAKVAEDARRASQMIPKIAHTVSRLEKAIIVAAQLQQLNVQNRIGICAARVTRKTREKLAWTFPKRVLLDQHGFDRRIERAGLRILAEAEAALRRSSEIQRQLDASRVMHRLKTAAANTRARAVEALQVAAAASRNLVAEKGATTVEQTVQRVVRETETALVAASSLREKIVGPHPHSMRQQTRRAIAETTSKAHKALLLRQQLGHRVAAIGFGSRIQILRAKLFGQVTKDRLQLTQQRAQLATLSVDRRLSVARAMFERARNAAFDEMTSAYQHFERVQAWSQALDEAGAAGKIQRAAQNAQQMLLARVQMLKSHASDLQDHEERRRRAAHSAQSALQAKRDKEAAAAPDKPSRLQTVIARGAASIGNIMATVAARLPKAPPTASVPAAPTLSVLASRLSDNDHSRRKATQLEITEQLLDVFCRNPALAREQIADWHQPALFRDPADREQISAVMAIVSGDVDILIRFQRAVNEARIHDARILGALPQDASEVDRVRKATVSVPPVRELHRQSEREWQPARQPEQHAPRDGIHKSAPNTQNGGSEADMTSRDRGIDPREIARRHGGKDLKGR
jgi:hypothetical protein